MSPQAICPECGNEHPFHEDEMKGVQAGEAVCAECAIERGYNVFLGEVLEGQHPELIKELQERLEEEA